MSASFKGRYETLDMSAEDEHEYSSISQVTGHFDAILCLEVIEHMSLNDYVDLMDEFGKLLRPGRHVDSRHAEPSCASSLCGPATPDTCSNIHWQILAADFVVRGYERRSVSRALWSMAKRSP